MVLRARLSAPQPAPKQEWPYHKPAWAVMPARLLMQADRRMEAENYLSHGYGIRLAIEARKSGWVKLERLANVSQPPRTKGTLVSQAHGKPFLAATQVFDVRPIPRKWLAPGKIEHAADLLVKSGTILVTRSGAVGRATITYTPHLEALISDDLLRIEPREEKHWGWLYAYLRALKVRAMMTSSRYGHVIKHLEVGHLRAIPIPLLDNTRLRKLIVQVREILRLRDQAYAATLEAENCFEQRLGSLKTMEHGETGFVVQAAKTIFLRGKRIDAARHIPLVSALQTHLKKNGTGVDRLGNCGFDIWVPGRYKRIPAADGVIFVGSSELFEINPDTNKRFADCKFGDKYKGRVQPGWLLMASSGQTYGLVGGVVLATQFYAGKVLANHVIRIAARKNAMARPGYVLTALSHPKLGRPLIKSLAFGSSVPEISPADVADFRLVRLHIRDENRIADLAEKSAELRGKADILENEVAAHSEQILDDFIK
jgi:type I restriction enzyme S subunit